MPGLDPQMERELTADIMRRVRLIRTMRVLVYSDLMKGAVFAVAVGITASLVSVHHIVQNMSAMPSIFSCVAYMSSAYLHTSFVVQALVAVALATAIWLVVDIGRNVAVLRFGFRAA